MFFFWQKAPTGKFIPCKSFGRPNQKSVNGRFTEMRGIIEIPKDEGTLSLQELARIHPCPEDKNG